MANMREVNRAIKAAFPALQIEAVRGDGYIYFIGDDGFDKIRSIYTHPVSTSTATLVRMCLERIAEELKEQEEHEQDQSAVCAVVVGSDCVPGVPDGSDLDSGHGACPGDVGPAPIKAGDRIVTVVGG